MRRRQHAFHPPREIKVIKSGFIGLCLSLLAALTALPASAEPRHGISAFGELKYPADFRHFDYANPDAPKGGELSLIGTARTLTFDSFNPFILKGNQAQGLIYLFDTLMVLAEDENDAVYGLIARTADVADDRLSVTFALRPEARFHDGTLVTAEDVKFSYEILISKGHPVYRVQLGQIEKAEILEPYEIKFTFKQAGSRDLPLQIATLPVLSKTWYTANDFEKSNLTPPLGSGPYKIKSYLPGRQVIFERDPNYWAKDLPVNRGQWNFDRLRYEYFRDRTAQFEAFKSGTIDLREEFTSKVWATEYNFPAIEKGWVIKETIPDELPSGTQGFFINTRREKFSDPRVREALGLAFDFEWTNRNLFYSLYARTNNFFQGSQELGASGPPTPGEAKLFEKYSDLVNFDWWMPAFTPPVTDGSGRNRRQIKAARTLLAEAGWTIQNQKLVNGKGEPFGFEILYGGVSFERILQPFARNLEKLGIDVSLRLVDSAQYEEKVKGFDFDMTTSRFVMRNTPGTELWNYFSSESAQTRGSLNLSGVAEPLIDALLDEVMAATTRQDLTAATKALDRTLRSQHYWIPHWFKGAHTIAYWDKFSRPPVKPRFARGIINLWWVDSDKNAALKKSKGQ